MKNLQPKKVVLAWELIVVLTKYTGIPALCQSVIVYGRFAMYFLSGLLKLWCIIMSSNDYPFAI